LLKTLYRTKQIESGAHEGKLKIIEDEPRRYFRSKEENETFQRKISELEKIVKERILKKRIYEHLPNYK
jgi:hypothetical protein